MGIFAEGLASVGTFFRNAASKGQYKDGVAGVGKRLWNDAGMADARVNRASGVMKGVVAADATVGLAYDTAVAAASVPLHLLAAGAGQTARAAAITAGHLGWGAAKLAGRGAAGVGKMAWNAARNGDGSTMRGAGKLGVGLATGAARMTRDVAAEAAITAKLGFQVGKGVYSASKSRTIQLGATAAIAGVAVPMAYQKGAGDMDFSTKLSNTTIASNGGNTFLYNSRSPGAPMNMNSSRSYDRLGADGSLVFALHNLRNGG